METITNRTPVVLLTGLGTQAARAGELLGPGTVLVHHDLGRLGEGVVVRTIRTEKKTAVAALELAHGCVSCTLREDLLPLLRKLHRRADVERIVLQLDPMMEVAEICHAIDHLSVVDVVGQVDGPAARDVVVEQVIAFIDGEGWLDQATGDTELAEFLPGGRPDDERTLAQVVVGQVIAADAIVVTGEPGHAHGRIELDAALRRLAPGAAVVGSGVGLPDVRIRARRGHRERTPDPHGPLLSGCPPLEAELGVRWLTHESTVPMHPGRLHEAIDALLDGVITARGRVWIATQPDSVLWLESAGGGLRVAEVGPWIDAMSPELAADTAATNPERSAWAALRWHPVYGDRHTTLAILIRDADPDEIHRALRWAELSAEEIIAGPLVWQTWPDPFGTEHNDPCETDVPVDSVARPRPGTGGMGDSRVDNPDSPSGGNTFGGDSAWDAFNEQGEQQ